MISGLFLLAAAGPSAAQTPLPVAMSEADFLTLLEDGTIDQLQAACSESLAAGLDQRLQPLRSRLLEGWPAPQNTVLVMANAAALIECRAPSAALTVLSRVGPAPGPTRRAWLVLRWQAADAALDHRRAARTLHRLVEGDLSRLDTVLLPVRREEDGTWTTRAAVDVLADHYEGMGAPDRAVEVLLASRSAGPETAQRLARAAALMDDLALERRLLLLEQALDQAAVDEAWGLALELLVLQESIERAAGGDAQRPRQRRDRLSRRLRDPYNQWRLLQDEALDPESEARRQRLEERLRSPRDPGGHGASTLPQAGP
ncbi:hypothetical protein EVJ50_13940 [Synechococcus sp. RSCCF101]|nr:hypothetical protein EVJ50_13940 [Synechococcus sp. RSCCF101]